MRLQHLLEMFSVPNQMKLMAILDKARAIDYSSEQYYYNKNWIKYQEKIIRLDGKK